MEVDDEGLITARSRGRSLWSRLLVLLLSQYLYALGFFELFRRVG